MKFLKNFFTHSAKYSKEKLFIYLFFLLECIISIVIDSSESFEKETVHKINYAELLLSIFAVLLSAIISAKTFVSLVVKKTDKDFGFVRLKWNAFIINAVNTIFFLIGYFGIMGSLFFMKFNLEEKTILNITSEFKDLDYNNLLPVCYCIGNNSMEKPTGAGRNCSGKYAARGNGSSVLCRRNLLFWNCKRRRRTTGTHFYHTKYRECTADHRQLRRFLRLYFCRLDKTAYSPWRNRNHTSLL